MFKFDYVSKVTKFFYFVYFVVFTSASIIK